VKWQSSSHTITDPHHNLLFSSLNPHHHLLSKPSHSFKAAIPWTKPIHSNTKSHTSHLYQIYPEKQLNLNPSGPEQRPTHNTMKNVRTSTAGVSSSYREVNLPVADNPKESLDLQRNGASNMSAQLAMATTITSSANCPPPCYILICMCSSHYYYYYYCCCCYSHSDFLLYPQNVYCTKIPSHAVNCSHCICITGLFSYYICCVHSH
jgi:hypothetical protein